MVGYNIIMPGQDGNSTFKLYVRSWCKSTAHTLASPFMVQTLFTGLTYVYHMEVSRQDLIPSILLLNITEHNFSEDEINYALDYITPWVSSYSLLLVQCHVLYFYTCSLSFIQGKKYSLVKYLTRKRRKDICVMSSLLTGF